MEEFKYQCELCNYKCKTKCNWHHHINTLKHLKKCTGEDDLDEYDYMCNNCSKMYKSKSGLWNHNKTCNPKLNDIIGDTDTINIPKEVWFHMIQESSEFKALLMESLKNNNNMISTINNGAISNTSHSNNNTNNSTNNNNHSNNTVNNHFNLQFFLNEQCKDAIDINEFVNSIQVTVDDLEETGRLGYAEGISRIIINNLKQLDIHKRPIHCSDLKRNMLYIRHLNAWEKDKENPKLMKNVINNVAMKNIGQLQNWKNMYPGCDAYNSHKKDTYLTIVQNSMNGSSEEEQSNNTTKIIKNVAKEVIIDKNT